MKKQSKSNISLSGDGLYWIRNFEVMWSKAGEVALSLNEGSFLATPVTMCVLHRLPTVVGAALDRAVLVFFGGEGQEVGRLLVPDDALVKSANSEEGLLVVEFDKTGGRRSYLFRNAGNLPDEVVS